ncbi:hypothetical protein BC938DRAFT_476090 [Jimgerdemannia flammicorona]|uniref:Uncharacterized protein n=1 Tax=Jimgerdemannia flammicorona TaxID=994334 RepID=A0A433PKB8_9FUNG|nr:hypothetical protein BC938DRAFT_476090 [Jimgerdemannia flammicorona]
MSNRGRDTTVRSLSPEIKHAEEISLSNGIPIMKNPPRRTSSLSKKQHLGLHDERGSNASFADELIGRFDTYRVHMRFEYELEKDHRLSAGHFDDWNTPSVLQQLTDGSQSTTVLAAGADPKQRNPIPSFEPPSISKSTSTPMKSKSVATSASSSYSNFPSARTPSNRSASSTDRHRAPIPSFEPPTLTPALTPPALSPPAPNGSLTDSYSFGSSPSTGSAGANAHTNGHGGPIKIPPMPTPPTVLPTTTAPAPIVVPPLSIATPSTILTGPTVITGPKKIEKLKYQVDSEPPETEEAETEVSVASSGMFRKSSTFFMKTKLFSGNIKPTKSSDNLKRKDKSPVRSQTAPAEKFKPSEPLPQAAATTAAAAATANANANTNRRSAPPTGNTDSSFNPLRRIKSNINDSVTRSVTNAMNRHSAPFLPTDSPANFLRRAKSNVNNDLDSNRPGSSHVHDDLPSNALRRALNNADNADNADNASSIGSGSPYGTVNQHRKFLDEDEPIVAIRSALAGLTPDPTPTPPVAFDSPQTRPFVLPPTPPEPEDAFSYARTKSSRPVSANGRVEDTQDKSGWKGLFGRRRSKESDGKNAAAKAGRRTSSKSTDEHSVTSEPTKKSFSGTFGRKSKKEGGRKVGWGWFGRKKKGGGRRDE